MRLCPLLLVLCVTCIWADEPAAEARFTVFGTVQRAATKHPVSNGWVEIRCPSREDRFAPIRVPIREDGSFRLVAKLAEVDLRDLPGQLTVSAAVSGLILSEVPLPVPVGGISGRDITIDFELKSSTLNGVLDIFSCCVLSWGILTVMLPAFLLGAAVTAFVPSHYLLRLLGPQAPQPVAYGTAIGSGMVLSLCSCNVVPLFVSIWKSGAGIGPAFAFLYAGPAINLVATIFTCRVIGLGIGIFRVLAVALMSLVVGLVMARLFKQRSVVAQTAVVGSLSMGPGGGVTAVLFVLLLYWLMVGSLELSVGWHFLLALPAVGGIVFIAIFKLGKDYTVLWMREAGSLLLKVIPIMIPAVLLIGFMAQKIPLRAVSWLSGSNSMACNALAATFGAFMYFPILTETAFVKTMLKVMGMGIGPGMALLLTAPGLSLPGMLIINQDIGWRKLFVYVMSITLMALLIGVFFGSEWGAYICSCLLE